MQQQEFNLQEAIDYPERAEEIVKRVQSAFTDLANSNLQAIKSAKDAQSLLDQYQKQAQLLTESNLHLADALKNVHIFLGSKKDLWKDDAEVNSFMDSLSTWVMSSGAIKLGAMAGAKNESR